jgi:hypothetical protein
MNEVDQSRGKPLARRLALGLALAIPVSLAAWLMLRESPAIEESRAVRVGMARADVERILGPARVVMYPASADTTLLLAPCKAVRPKRLRLRNPPAFKWRALRRPPLQLSKANARIPKARAR